MTRAKGTMTKSQERLAADFDNHVVSQCKKCGGGMKFKNLGPDWGDWYEFKCTKCDNEFILSAGTG